jgi:hypothetical protein
MPIGVITILTKEMKDWFGDNEYDVLIKGGYFMDKLDLVKEYLDYCVLLKDKGINHGIELVRHDISSIIDANEGDKIVVGSFITKKEMIIN